LKRDYEKELIVDVLGYVKHDCCVEHCLNFAFGSCKELHPISCEKCSKVDSVFQQILEIIPNEKNKIIELRDKLQHYWAHQVRKTYLNAQVNAALLRLDEDGAVIIADYKMKILPQSAREVKSDFFGKKGFTLHTLLVYTKKSNDSTSLNIEAMDHWSADPTQDAWFTASSFDALFSTMEKKPSWVEILSDNGAHYHNKELMIMISQWSKWYDIEVKSWTFLEPGEAKTAVDSHHAQV
jgi:hypothetical protein